MLNNLWERAKTVVAEFGEVTGLSNLMPDQGRPDASDFHDSGATTGGGLEVMTGENQLNSAGTSDELTSENGSTAIVDEMLAPGSGNRGSFVRGNSKKAGTVHDVARAVTRADEAVDKANEGKSQDTTIISYPGSEGSVVQGLEDIEWMEIH